jgi:hypothetical protein
LGAEDGLEAPFDGTKERKIRKVYAEKPCDNTHELDLDLGAEDGLKPPFDGTKERKIDEIIHV